MLSMEWNKTLRGSHHRRNGISNHHPRDCVLSELIRRRSKKTSKHCVTGLCAVIHWWPVNSLHKWPVMPPSHCREFGLQTNTNWHSLLIAQHRIDSNYFVLVRCHFCISSQANTNRSLFYCVVLHRLTYQFDSVSYWFVSHRCAFLSICCTFDLGFATCLLQLSTWQYSAQRPHCRIGSHMFALVRVSSN